MDMGNPTPMRQNVRHRRSDRYLQQEQAPVQQPTAPKQAQPDTPPSVPQRSAAPVQQQAAPMQAQPNVPQPAPQRSAAPVQQPGVPMQAQPNVPQPAPQRSAAPVQQQAAPMQTQANMPQPAPQRSAAPVQQQAAPKQAQPIVPPSAPRPSAPSAHQAAMSPQAQWPQMTRSQQPLGNTIHPQQHAQPTVSNAQHPLNHTIPPQQAQRMPMPQYPQQQQWPQQQPMGSAGHPQQAGYMQPPQSLSHTIPPQQPAGAYAQPQTAWQQPFYAQQGHEAPQPTPEAQPQRMPDVQGEQPSGGFPWKAVVAALALLALIVGGVFGIRAAVRENGVRSYVAQYDTKFCEGVYVDGIHLGGMTQQEGIEAVTNQAQQRNSNWYVRLTYQGQTVVEIKAAQLGMRVDVADALRRAWEQGHASNDAHERQEAMAKLLEEPYYDFTALPSGDTSVVDNVLEELRNKVYRAPQDAYIAEFDPAKTYPFTIVDEVQGMMLNTDSLKERIYQMVSTMESGELEVEPEYIAPNVTAAQLRASVTLRGDAYTEISTTSTDNRNENIKRAFALITGTILKPGETFSFNGVVGRRTTANGFYEATEYAYGKEVQGIGGGVCQASTTLYLAAVAANLKITKHTPHSMAVGYTTYGKDATVSWEGNRQVDFAFTNNTDGNIYIVSSVQYDRTISKYNIARVRIYGPYLGDGVSYRLEAQEVETIPLPDPEYRKDTKGEYADKITYTDEEYVVSKGREGHITESYSVKYVNGVEVERTFLFRDVYNAAAPIIYRGTQERW